MLAACFGKACTRAFRNESTAHALDPARHNAAESTEFLACFWPHLLWVMEGLRGPWSLSLNKMVQLCPVILLPILGPPLVSLLLVQFARLLLSTPNPSPQCWANQACKAFPLLDHLRQRGTLNTACERPWHSHTYQIARGHSCRTIAAAAGNHIEAAHHAQWVSTARVRGTESHVHRRI